MDLSIETWRWHVCLIIFRGQNEGFSEEQVEMYRECFKLMDIDKVLLYKTVNPVYYD